MNLPLTKLIIEPGIYEDLTNREYHQSDAVSRSDIPLILRSPAHYWAAKIDPDRDPYDEKPAKRFGSAFHMYLLERDKFETKYEVLPEYISKMAKNNNKYKDYIAEVQTRNRLPLTTLDMKKIKKMTFQVENHPDASLLIKDALCEVSFYWVDEDTGVLCKCRPDVWEKGLAIPDIKTTEDAREWEFSKSIANYEYHLQNVFYCDGVEAATGERLPMPFIAIEKQSPYAVSVYEIDDDEKLASARNRYKKALDIYAHCRALNQWPAYPPGVKLISLPSWAK